MTGQLNYLVAQERIADLRAEAERAPLARDSGSCRRLAVLVVVTAALAAAAAPSQARVDLNPERSTALHATSSGVASSTSASPCSEVCSGHGYGPADSVSTALRPAVHGSDLDRAYITVGAPAAGLALLGVGGSVTVTRRRAHRQAAQQPTIAA